jgi:hypothetical protein
LIDMGKLLRDGRRPYRRLCVRRGFVNPDGARSGATRLGCSDRFGAPKCGRDEKKAAARPLFNPSAHPAQSMPAM